MVCRFMTVNERISINSQHYVAHVRLGSYIVHGGFNKSLKSWARSADIFPTGIPS